MLRYMESTGKNEEEAIQAALRTLGLDRDEISVEVLERAKSGFLGIGSSPARIRVTYEVPDEPAPPAEEPAPPAGEAPAPEAPAPAPVPEAAPVVEEEAVSPLGDRASAIEGFLTGLMAHMEVEASPRISMEADGSYHVELVGQDLGALIGRRGETLDAIQQLTSYAVNRGQSKRGAHPCGRGELPGQAGGVPGAPGPQGGGEGGQVPPERDSGAHERLRAHVIHTALQDYPDVTTYSIGTEPNRRTVVAYARGEHRA